MVTTLALSQIFRHKSVTPKFNDVVMLMHLLWVYRLEDLTLVVISYEIYEMTTSARFCLSYDRFKLDFIVLKVDIISIENATLSRTSL